jgi:hypothetical protein
MSGTNSNPLRFSTDSNNYVKIAWENMSGELLFICSVIECNEPVDKYTWNVVKTLTQI